MAAPVLGPILCTYDDWNIGDNAARYTTPSPHEDGETPETELQNTQEASQSTQPSQCHELPEAGEVLGAWKTPAAYTENSAQTFGFQAKKAEERNKRLGAETRRVAVGPMPVEDFLAAFFNHTPNFFENMPSSDRAFESVPAKASKESDLYKPLIIALNAAPGEKGHGSRCPGFTFRDTSNHPDQSGGKLGAKKPDICCYADHHLSAVEPSRRKDLVSRTDMGLAATYFEIKSKASADVFFDPPSGVDRATWQFVFKDLKNEALEAALEILGQHTAYASEIGMRQFRSFVFSITMVGIIVRLMRWDRAGVIVSEAFDLHRNPEYLCKFLWCFSHASDFERGYDLTAVPAQNSDEQVFVDCINAHIKAQLPEATEQEYKTLLGEHFAPGVVTSIFVSRKMQGSAVTTPYEYLVSRPVVAPLSMIGRGTRGYWAVDRRTRKVLYLKDTWRSGTREGEIIEDLCYSEVSVPPVEYHGDVPIGSVARDGTSGRVYYLVHGRPQTTLTHSFLNKNWICGQGCEGGLVIDAIVRRTRYRLVSKYAGFSLERLTGTAELLSSVHDAYKILNSAYSLCQRVHRNISPSNIILFNDDLRQPHRRGFLVDWELSCKVNVSERRINDMVSMNWQFLSVPATMKLNGERHRIQDDMESLYWVVIYCALLYLNHGLPGNDLLDMLSVIFDRRIKRGVSDLAKAMKSDGEGKYGELHIAMQTRHVAWPNAPLATWISTVRSTLRQYLTALELGSVEEARQLWSPSIFTSFWAEFFTKYPKDTIPNDDRQENITNEANKTNFSPFAPRSALMAPVQATMAYSPRYATPAAESSSRTASVPQPVERDVTSKALHSQTYSGVASMGSWRGAASSSASSAPSLATSAFTSATGRSSASAYTNTTVGLSGPFDSLATSTSAFLSTSTLASGPVNATSQAPSLNAWQKIGPLKGEKDRSKRKARSASVDDSSPDGKKARAAGSGSGSGSGRVPRQRA
ncbi:hypothetical protein C2E23DRAFT_363420 [Lenzites betulinus]|nr:hypothetical protein C2E23DRAFT_363420 [Lenzites betulinus]